MRDIVATFRKVSTKSGQAHSVVYPNGQTSTYTYLPTVQDRRLQTIHHRDPGGATVSKFDYTYDVVGNVLSWQQQSDSLAPVIWEYGYDPADQLTRAVKRTTGTMPTVIKRYAWGYDAAGNRLYEQVDDAVTGWTYDSLNRLVTQYGGGKLRFAGTVNEPATVTIQGKPATVTPSGAFASDAAVTAGANVVAIEATDAAGNVGMASYQVSVGAISKTFTSDANGNLINDGERVYAWDALNQLVSISNGSWQVGFSYDGQKRRVGVSRSSSGQSVSASLINCGRVPCEARSSDGQIVARLWRIGFTNGASVHRFVTLDHLDSVGAITDDTGAVVDRQSYLPWGIEEAAPSANIAPSFAGLATFYSTGLHFASHRAYAPELGRWLSEDPAGMVDGPNRFTYSTNRPATMADPTGLFVTDPSCDRCIPAGNGPGDGRSPARYEIFDATEKACRGSTVSGIKPARLRACVRQLCVSGKVTCLFDDKRCDRNSEAGGFARPNIFESWKGEAFLCIKNWPSQTSGVNIGRAVIHEWAHTCGWDHEDGGDVPPRMF
jgi:RHS repeat-associated protein